MFLADTLSRAFPVCETVRDDPEMLNIVHTISKHLPMSEKRRVQFKKETELDPELQIVVKYIKEVVIDYYSKWIEIAELVNKSAEMRLNKKLELGMSEKALVDHIFVRLEPQVQNYVEVRNPQTAIQLLEVLAKFE
ncbi:transposon Tf2-6 polyprotein [Trichonephila clavipes]|nr:transposon Tf2-6 polyprotein [Trichonephila clavipes]